MALDGRGRSSTTLIVENAIEEREGRSECNSGVRMPQPPQQQKHSDHGDRDDRRPERAPEHRGKPCDGDGRSAVIRAHHVIPGAVDAEGQAAGDARDQEAAEQDRGDACRAEGDPSPPADYSALRVERQAGRAWRREHPLPHGPHGRDHEDDREQVHARHRSPQIEPRRPSAARR